MRWPTTRSDSARLSPPSSTRAISAVRSASRRRRSASSVRERAVPARVEVTAETARKTARATQFCSSASVKLPVGGRWKKLKARALTIDVAAPSTKPPELDAISTGSR